MVIVAGSVQITPEKLTDALKISLQHVRRSRLESGCSAHAVHQDAEDPCKLFFFEQWSGKATLEAHFLVPESGLFVREITRCATSAPEILIYAAEAI